ncbi:flagella synthesis protein FlgN [Pontibacter sp. JAM-7]|uniref:flagella synthesis protein FlgN n=1 Tax=Pontibacter sp. JAM-7 TaxID=3366581 RepID=UPI003AF75B97
MTALLQEGIKLLQTLDQVYDAELEILSQQDLDALSDITQRKTSLLTEFQQFRVKRTELLSSYGINSPINGYRLPESEPASSLQPELSQAVTELENQLQQMQRKNTRNETVISRSQRNVQQLLAIIRGQRQEDKLYDQSGSAGLYKAQSRIGKA